MALTLKKTPAGVLIPKHYNYLGGYSSPHANEKIESIIHEAIRDILHTKLGKSSLIYIRRLLYFPVYGYDSATEEKSIINVYMKIRSRNPEFVKLSIDEIERAGVSLVEFFDYINTNGAKEVKSAKITFEQV